MADLVQTIKRNVSCKQFLEDHGYHFDNHGFCKSIVNSGEKTPSMHLHNGCIKDFSSGEYFDLIAIASVIYYGCKRPPDFQELLHRICDEYHISYETTEEDSEENTYYNVMKYITKVFHSYNKLNNNLGYQLWSKRGFDKDFVDKYQLGFYTEPFAEGQFLSTLKTKFGNLDYYGLGIVDKNGNVPYSNRLIIPIRNKQGRVVSFTARTILPEGMPKYKLMRTNKYYKKQENLFLFDKCLGNSNIILVEGHMDALSLHQAGYINAVALAGCELSDVQALQLTGKNVILALDNDDAGIKATAKILNRYPTYDFDVVKYQPNTKDFNDILMSGEAINIETMTDIEFIARYNVANTTKKDALNKFIDYIIKKYNACKPYLDHMKLGCSLYGLSEATKYLNKELDMSIDLMEVIDKVYG